MPYCLLKAGPVIQTVILIYNNNVKSKLFKNEYLSWYIFLTPD